MSLSKEIRSPLAAIVDQDSQSWLWNKGSHQPGQSSITFSKISWRKAICLLTARLKGMSWDITKTALGWNLHQMTAHWLCGLETGAYKAKVAISLQLSFCEKNNSA
jgi:hypothetical protein